MISQRRYSLIAQTGLEGPLGNEIAIHKWRGDAQMDTNLFCSSDHKITNSRLYFGLFFFTVLGMEPGTCGCSSGAVPLSHIWVLIIFKILNI